MREECGSCRYWYDENTRVYLGAGKYEAAGYCRRRSPTIHEYDEHMNKTRSTITSFPMVARNQWCGEYEQPTPTTKGEE
jgi:hypothetical protein